MQEDSRKIASNTMVQIIGRVIVLAISLVSIKLITNYLGAQGTGLYNTIITYFSLFIVVADFGLFSVAVREIAKTPHRSKEILTNIFSIRFASAFIVTAIAVLIAASSHYQAEIKYGVLVASLFPLFNLASSVYDMLFQARLQMQKVVIAEVISRLVAVLGVLAAIYFNLGFYAIVFTVSLAAIVNFLVKALYSRRELPIGFGYNHQIISWVVRLSLPLGIVFIVNNLYFRVDTLILFYLKGAVDVGIYSVAYKVLETTLFAGSYLASSLKPLFATAIDKDKARAEKMLSQSLTFLLFMALTVAVVSTSLSKEIILFLSNDQFIGGANALIILGFASIFIYLSGVLGEIMIAKDMRKTLITIAISILIFNVALNLILIPLYSYIGAAYATLSSEILLLATGYLVTRRVVNIKIDFMRIAKLLSIAATTVGLSFLIKIWLDNFLLLLLFNLGFYLGLSYLWDAVPRQSINSYLIIYQQKWLKRK